MLTYIDHLRHIRKYAACADPFSNDYNREEILGLLKSAFPELPADADLSIIDHAGLFNNFYKELSAKIEEIIKDIPFSKEEFLEACFRYTNAGYWEIIEESKAQYAAAKRHDLEALSFTKIKNAEGKEVSAKYGSETLVDVLDRIVELLEKRNDWGNTKEDGHSKSLLRYVQRLFLHVNLLLNLKSTYETVLFENAEIFIEGDTVKVRYLSKAIPFTQVIGDIRTANNLQENRVYFEAMRKHLKAKRKGAVKVACRNGLVTWKIGELKSISDEQVILDATYVTFFHHFEGLKLGYFNNLTLSDLGKLFALTLDLFDSLKNDSSAHLTGMDVPIKIKANEMRDYLIRCSGCSKDTIEKFLLTLTKDSPVSSFRSPLFRIGDHYYFPLLPVMSPNLKLFFEKWIKVSGYSLDDVAKLYAAFVRRDLSFEDLPYHVQVVSASSLGLDDKAYESCVILRTRDMLILMEAAVYELPIESAEYGQAMISIMEAIERLNERKNEIQQKGMLSQDLEIVTLVLTASNELSGLQVNGTPVLDLTLLRNYLEVGSFRTAKLVTGKNGIQSREIAAIDYYTNEDQFNQNFKVFIKRPKPIHSIWRKLYLKDQPITPDSITPQFFIESVDFKEGISILDDEVDNLADTLNYEYFGEPSADTKALLDKEIFSSLSKIFHALAHEKYETYPVRHDTYAVLRRTKRLGFAHLAHYITASMESLSSKPVRKNKSFTPVEVDEQTVLDGIVRLLAEYKGPIRLSEFEIKVNLGQKVEKEIISAVLGMLSTVTPQVYSDNDFETWLTNIAVLAAFSKKYELSHELYALGENLIEALNFNHMYQKARDLSEELLVLSINSNNHVYGWKLLFRAYTSQHNQFDAAIYGCLFLTAMDDLPEIPYPLSVDVLFKPLVFFRTFHLQKWAEQVFEASKEYKLTGFDQQKLAIAYFNSAFTVDGEESLRLMNEGVDYLHQNCAEIVSFGLHGIVPWLAFLYNIDKIRKEHNVKYDRPIDSYIEQLEANVPPSIIKDLRARTVFDVADIKSQFINSLVKVYETRDVSDFIYEVQRLLPEARKLVDVSLLNNDPSGLMLAGLVINDQSVNYPKAKTKSSMGPLMRPEDPSLRHRLNNYLQYVIDTIKLEKGQLLVWLFEHHGNIYCLFINSDKAIIHKPLQSWDKKTMETWLKEMDKFYFNSKKEKYYLFEQQSDDYEAIRKQLEFTELNIGEEYNEILITTDIVLSAFPHNLIQDSKDFIAFHRPVCNILTIENYINNPEAIQLDSYSLSAWIPVDDEDPTISWGHALLTPLLEERRITTYTSRYPGIDIATDINIFMAHGIKGTEGFKAVYTNERGESAILDIKKVFGSGKIAILFICNSGSAREEGFSQSVVSFSNTLLAAGYKAVIAPFWRLDVTIPSIWLKEFLDAFDKGNRITQAVFLANKKVSDYDQESGRTFYAPTGWAAMHLYGNPNVSLKH